MTSPHALRLANILDLVSRLLVGGRGGGRKGLLVLFVLGLLLLCNRKASVSSSGVDGVDLLPRDDDEGGIGGDDACDCTDADGCCCDDETCRWDGEGTGLDDDDDLEDDCCLFNDCCCG